MPRTSLPVDQHRQVQALIQDFERGDENTKIVAIRDDLAMFFKDDVLKWRLLADEIGIHPCNRETLALTANGCQFRGKKVMASGFSFAAIGNLWASEENPKTNHIGKHTTSILMSNEEFAPPTGMVKAGPLNWTHTNQFCRMVDHRRPCSLPGLPVDRDNRLDKSAIQSDPKQAKLFKYLSEGMVVNVLPYWVEEQYPAVVKIFSVAANQEQQLQEGRCLKQQLQHIMFSMHAFNYIYMYI